MIRAKIKVAQRLKLSQGLALYSPIRSLRFIRIIIGMVIIGFGFLIYLLPKLFATLASIVFWVIGIGCLITAVKIFLITKDHDDSDSSGGYRENVQIHIEEHHQ